MGIIITCECGKICKSQIKDQVSTNINQIIINSKEEYNNNNNNSRNTQYTNTISNSNFNLNPSISSNTNEEKNYKMKPSSFLKSKFCKNNTDNLSDNFQIKLDKRNVDKYQTENKNKMNRRNSYLGNDLIISHEEVSKNISKIQKTFHSNLLESLKEIEDNEKELNDRIKRKKFNTKKYNNKIIENKEKENKKENEENKHKEDEICIKEDDNIFRTMSVKNNKSKKLKSTGDIMFSGLNLNDVYEIRGFFQLKKNINFKFYGKKEIDGTKNSFGIIKWEDGSKLTTIFKNSKINNYGIFKDTNNLNNIEETSYFYGYYQDNIPKGYGYYIKNSIKIESDGWYKNNINGIGIEFNLEDDSIYKGDFINSIKNGLGIFRYNDGTISYGEWYENKLNGYGIIHFTNDCIYIGQFKNNIFDGFGEFLWPDGKYYCGDYKNGIKNGFGIFVWNFNNNDAYIGFWDDGKSNGVGIKLDDNNCKLCNWKEGRKINNIKIWDLDDYLKKEQYKFKKLFEKGSKFFIKFIHKLRNGILNENFLIS